MRYSNISTEDHSDRWCVSIVQATKMINNTTHKFIRSVLLPLSSRYRTDRMFLNKTLIVEWSTETFDGRTNLLVGNRCAQVFANKGYFLTISDG